MAVAGSALAPFPADGDERGTTRIVSVASDGTPGDRDSDDPSISADGRYVAFRSGARNLVAGDTNPFSDIFLRDTQTSTTTQVSVASDGSQGNGFSSLPSISADGHYVAFTSAATNLVAGDTNGVADIFLHDTQTGTTTRVSVASDGSQGNEGSSVASISADGRYLAFSSDATNLMAGDTNGVADIFLHDTQTGTTTRVSVASDGSQGNNRSFWPSISADGRYVAFSSRARNLVLADTNRVADIFVRDTQSGTTNRVSVASDGSQANGNSFVYGPSISADGRHVAFESWATNLMAGDTNAGGDIFVRDRQRGTTNRVSVASVGSQGNDYSSLPSISADGRYVAFESWASNLVAGDTNEGIGRGSDVFVHDMRTGTTLRVSVASDGSQVPRSSYASSISANGRYVAFAGGKDLVGGDTNRFNDVFIRALDLCADGIDNDGDGSIDHPADAGCASAADFSEGRVFRPQTRPTIHYRSGDFRGRVASAKNRCIKHRKVILKRKRSGKVRKVGHTRTDRDGRWDISKPGVKGRYYARVKKQVHHNRYFDTIVCRKGQSLAIWR